MSKRTFFRYFPSKDDLVIGKYDLFADRMAEAFDARPADEPVWESLRRLFDTTLDYIEDDRQRARNEAMDEIVRSTPSCTPDISKRCSASRRCLRSGWRAGYSVKSTQPPTRGHALVGAAFASMQAARQAWFASDRSAPFSSYVDDAMSAVELVSPTRGVTRDVP